MYYETGTYLLLWCWDDKLSFGGQGYHSFNIYNRKRSTGQLNMTDVKVLHNLPYQVLHFLKQSSLYLEKYICKQI
jgi:hypothetical protein